MTKNIPINQVDTHQADCLVHLKVFKIIRTDADIEYLSISDLIRLKYAELSWMIETYHRGIKQFCGIERWSG